MNHVAVSGSQGFLGWHVRSAMLEQAMPSKRISLGDSFDADEAAQAVSGAARAIHLAGVNRGTDEEVSEGNLRLAEQFAQALRGAKVPPNVTVFANSIQAGNNTHYGTSKARSAELIAKVSAEVGSTFVDLQLPNLFGEHGRPFYNSVTSTFCSLLADGGTPTVEQDRELTLLHVQDAADLLLGTASAESMAARQSVESVTGLLRRLTTFAETYRSGDIPDVSTDFDRNLFNTFRSYTFPQQTPIRLTRHADNRGSFFEVIRTHGGTGQASFSTTVPGVTRGDHFHRRKIERFTVLQGTARISLRRVFTREVYSFDLTGDEPAAIDMPTMWAHNISNIGTEILYTSFWTNDIFDPASPDTISEAV